MRLLPWLSLAAFTILWVARWPSFPLVLDPYYHLLIAQQVADAGGPIAYEAWEYAPIGRPHLYPPLLHLLLAVLLKAGVPALAIIRLVTATLLPALLLTIYLVMRRLFTSSIALACLWAAMLPFSFHLHTAITLAATLAMIELLWMLDAIEHGRLLAAGVLLGMVPYTHLGFSGISIAIVISYAVLRPSMRQPALNVLLTGLLLALPWWWHVLSHRAAFHPVARYENQLLEVVPALLAAATLGAWRCWHQRNRATLLLACWLGFAVLAFRYRFRWVSGEGMLPVILLAGMGIEWISLRLAGSRRRLWVMGAIVGVLACGPTLIQDEFQWKLVWPDSGPAHLLGMPGIQPKTLETSLATPPVGRLVDVVRRQTSEREILWSNAPYAVGLIAAMAKRPMSSAMFSEVVAAQPFDPVEAAHLIIWFKYEPIAGEVRAARLSRLRLVKVFEDDVATVYRRQEALPLAAVPTAAIPLSLAVALVAVALGVILWDNVMGSGTSLPVSGTIFGRTHEEGA
jgi:hypothetical protein